MLLRQLLVERSNIPMIDENIEKAIDVAKSDLDWGGGDGETMAYMFTSNASDPDYQEQLEEMSSEEIQMEPGFGEFVDRYFKRQASDILYEIAQRIDGNHIKIARKITAPDEWKPEQRPLGIYWSWNAESADSHWGDQYPFEYLIVGIVDIKNVNWVNTIAANLHVSIGEDEREIQLYDGAPVKIESITKFKAYTAQVVPADYDRYVGKILRA